jgi:hypothetical protein
MKKTVTQYIECPECGTVQSASVVLGRAFDGVIHTCGDCEHEILQSEFKPAKPPCLDTIAAKMNVLLAYLKGGIGIRRVKPKKEMIELAETLLDELKYKKA